MVRSFLLLLCALCAGCTSVIRGPAGPVSDPVTVFVTFEARHRGLLLPRGTSEWVEYGFGEYAWYATKRDQWYRVFPAVLWPTSGTLSRREFPHHGIEDLHTTLSSVTLRPLVVERSHATRVVQDLDRAFDQGSDQVAEDFAHGKRFVRAPRSYWCCFNCNDALARWLVELGCSVSFVPIRLDLAVAGQDP